VPPPLNRNGQHLFRLMSAVQKKLFIDNIVGAMKTVPRSYLECLENCSRNL